MNMITIIPARMGSSRFPGKPMADINGKPMIGHVYDGVKGCSLVNKTVVATCDQEIFDYIESIGGESVMTSSSHDRASDRCAEALSIIEGRDGVEYEIVVMVQGDEPLTKSEMISEAIRPMLSDQSINVVNLLGKIETRDEFYDPNCIKVVVDNSLNAIYFSRSPIPNKVDLSKEYYGKQVCVIPFRRSYLYKYIELKPTPLEISESVDMLRILEHGDFVRMVKTNYMNQAVDTIEDLRKVEKIMSEDA